MLSYFFSLGYNNYQKRQQQQEGGNGGSPRSQRHNFQTQQQQSSGGRMSPQQQNQNQQQGQGQQAGQFQQQKKTSKCHISIELYIICPWILLIVYDVFLLEVIIKDYHDMKSFSVEWKCNFRLK